MYSCCTLLLQLGLRVHTYVYINNLIGAHTHTPGCTHLAWKRLILHYIISQVVLSHQMVKYISDLSPLPCRPARWPICIRCVQPVDHSETTTVSTKDQPCLIITHLMTCFNGNSHCANQTELHKAILYGMFNTTQPYKSNRHFSFV